MSKSVLLVGEPMGLFIANEMGRLEDVRDFTLATCGAELNVAIGLQRLGHDVTYMTKLGRDPFGRKIVNFMKANGLFLGGVRYSDSAPTGFMLKSKVLNGDPEIFYARKGSAASTLSAGDMAGLDYSQFDIVHLTGITPALSSLTRQASDKLNHSAIKNGCFFSFDPNLRPQLWSSRKEMTEYINEMAFRSDLFLPGIAEAEILMGAAEPEQIARYYLERGTGTIVIKNGADGAYYEEQNGSHGYIPGFFVERVIDTVGAGDGFAAGVLSGIREGLELARAVRRGCAMGAIQVMCKGDNDGLPTRKELDLYMSARVKGAC